MAKISTTYKKRPVEQYGHKAKTRPNNPPVGLVDAKSDAIEEKKKYAYDPHLDPGLEFDQQSARTKFTDAFPMAGEKEGWARLAKNLKAEIDEDAMEAYRGTLSLPFKLGKHSRAAVKIVDDRGIESLKIMGVV